MRKQTCLLEIDELLTLYYDDIIDDACVCDVYDEDGNEISTNEAVLTEVFKKPNGNVYVSATRHSDNKTIIRKIESYDAKTIERIWSGLRTRREGYKQEKVEERTREVANEMMKRFNELVNKALNTSAFDWDYAFQNGYVIPKAIIGAIAKTVMDECTCGDSEIRNERDNIYQFL